MNIEASGAPQDDVVARSGRDLFISYSSPDLDSAHAIRIVLESSGYSCWMAPDDIIGTAPWAEQIAAAVARCRAMLVLVSQASVVSRHVPKETELAFGKAKPLIPVRLEDVTPTGSLEYLLSLAQWIDVFPGPLEAHAEELVSRITRALDAGPGPGPTRSVGGHVRETPRSVPVPPLIRPRSGARRIRRVLFALAAIAAVVISILSFVRADAAVLMQTQDLRVDPNPAHAGATARAIGRGWAAGNPVEIQWDAAYGTVVGTGVTDASGTFSISFTVPAGVTGSHAVWACQYARGTACTPSNEFKVMLSTVLAIAPDTPPVANPDRFATAMGEPIVIPDAALTENDFDPDGDALCSTVRIVDPPTQGTLGRLSDLIWLYTPRPDVVGADGFTYRVCDRVNGAWSNTTTVTIEIVFAGSISLSPDSGRPGTEVTVTGVGFVSGAPVDVRWDGSRVATADADGEGSFSARFTVGSVAPGTYSIRACSVDTPACATGAFVVTAPPPPDTTTTSLVTTTTSAPTTTRTPTTTTTTATTTPTVSTSATTTTTTTTIPDNVPPIASDDPITLADGRSIEIPVIDNDRDPDGVLDLLSVRIVLYPRFGSAEVSAPGVVTYVAGDGFTGTDGFRYEVCDDGGLCASATVSIRSAEVPPCAVADVRAASLTVSPDQGPPGTHADLVLTVERAGSTPCILPVVQFFWGGEPWGEPVAFVDTTAIAGRIVPNDVPAGGHEITARPVDGDRILASTSFTVSLPPITGDDDAPTGGSSMWPWFALGAVGAGALGWLGRLVSVRRKLAALRSAVTRAEAKARDLLTEARTLDAELDECEQHHGRGMGVLPTGASASESAGGTAPYLVEYENPYAPLQEDGHRGWYHPRRKEPIRGIVIHTTDGMGLGATTADHVARFFATSRTPASAHAVVDARGAITLLPDGYTALHAPLANSASLGLVVCLTGDADEQRLALEHAARWCRARADEHGFPLELIDADAWRIGGYGIIGHSELDPEAPDPVGPGSTEFPWGVLLDGSKGPSKFPAVVPVQRDTRFDPCAELRAKAARLHDAAGEASREAKEATRRLAEHLERR